MKSMVRYLFSWYCKWIIFSCFSGLVWFEISVLMLDFVLILADSLTNSNILQKVNMCYLCKEATKKDKSFKTQLYFTLNDEKPTETERIWKYSGFLMIKRETSRFPRNIF